MNAQLNPTLLLFVPLAPLAGALLVGLFGTRFFGNLLGRKASHTVAILGVLIALGLSIHTLFAVKNGAHFDGALYTWMAIEGVRIELGFLIDSLAATMMCVVTFISLMVHVYTIGYMDKDEGYNRFFAYISLFTFAMLMLVMSNNLLQLFFGWEAVGLVSYLLIGFWYDKPTAIAANMKAFIVNRVGDAGFIIGIGLLFAYAGSMHYGDVFAVRLTLADIVVPGTSWNLLSVSCICLFIGAMAKSAQFPLHVWLPDSMEGPTPISALIHAATMVTAGIFMVTRMSPLFELTETALSFMLVIGAITALFMGLVGMVQNDIKRVIAYSTLSQLGYMTVALGVSAYSASIFHLMTHAFFKALLFLAAGSVIIGMHHEQNIRYMGGVGKYMPITRITALIGSLALIGTPFFSGFYSKESIIEAVHHSQLPLAEYAYPAILLGVFVTAFYTFRWYFVVFHGEERFGPDNRIPTEVVEHGLEEGEVPHETPWTMTVPLILLAIPSILIGYFMIEPMLYGDFFGDAIVVSQSHDVMAIMAGKFDGPLAMALHAFTTEPLMLTLGGVALAAYLYLFKPGMAVRLAYIFGPFYNLLIFRFYLDHLNNALFVRGARLIGAGFWKLGDQSLIDGMFVNGSAKVMMLFSGAMRRWQSGRLYYYALVMIVGVLGFMFYLLPSPFAG